MDKHKESKIITIFSLILVAFVLIGAIITIISEDKYNISSKISGKENKKTISPEEKMKQKETEMRNKGCEYFVFDKKVKVTYDKGEHWVEVPVDIDKLTERAEEVKDKSKLQEGSYYISPNKIAFVYGGTQENPVTVLSSDDKGKTWKRQAIENSTRGSRMEFIGFSSKDNGYIVVSGDRTMSFEITYVYLTKDGGKTWTQVGDPSKATSVRITGATFSTDKIGFICYKSTSKYPSVYFTKDSGTTWKKLEIPLPKEYEGIFVTPLSPKFNGAKGVLIVDQGEDGDFGQGKKARFISEDYGLSWNFDKVIEEKKVE